MIENSFQDNNDTLTVTFGSGSILIRPTPFLASHSPSINAFFGSPCQVYELNSYSRIGNLDTIAKPLQTKHKYQFISMQLFGA